MDPRLSLRLLAACLLAGMLGGCASPPRTALRHLDVVAEPGANGGMATALDIVFVHDSSASASLPKTGPAWFQARQQSMDAFGQSLQVVSLQLVPGQSTQIEVAGRMRKALVVHVYANVQDPRGQAVGNISSDACTSVSITPTTVLYRRCMPTRTR